MIKKHDLIIFVLMNARVLNTGVLNIRTVDMGILEIRILNMDVLDTSVQ